MGDFMGLVSGMFDAITGGGKKSGGKKKAKKSSGGGGGGGGLTMSQELAEGGIVENEMERKGLGPAEWEDKTSPSLSTPQNYRTEVDATADGTWLETEASEFHYLAGFEGIDDAPWSYLNLTTPVWFELSFGELAKIQSSDMAAFPVLCKDVVNDPITVVTVDRDSRSGTHGSPPPGGSDIQEYYTFVATEGTQYPDSLVGQGAGAGGGVIPDWDGWDWNDTAETNTYDNVKLNKFFLLMSAESAALIDTSFEQLRTGVEGAVSEEVYEKLKEEFDFSRPAMNADSLERYNGSEIGWQTAITHYCKCGSARRSGDNTRAGSGGAAYGLATFCMSGDPAGNGTSYFLADGFDPEDVFYMGLAMCQEAGVTPTEAGVYGTMQASTLSSAGSGIMSSVKAGRPGAQVLDIDGASKVSDSYDSSGASSGGTYEGTLQAKSLTVSFGTDQGDEAIGNYARTSFNNAIGSRQYRQFAAVASGEQMGAVDDYRDYVIDPQQISYNKNMQGIVITTLASSYTAGNIPIKYSTNKLKRNLPLKVSNFISTRMHETTNRVKETVTVITYTNQSPATTVVLAETTRPTVPVSRIGTPGATTVVTPGMSDFGGAGPISLPTAPLSTSPTASPTSESFPIPGGGSFGPPSGY